MALAYSDNEHLRSREVREKFAKHAKLFLEAECRSATLSTVQGLAVLSSFHSGLAEQSEPSFLLGNDTETDNPRQCPGLGFMYFGMFGRKNCVPNPLIQIRPADRNECTDGSSLYVVEVLQPQSVCASDQILQ